MEQATILMQDTGIKPATAFVDLGYRGVEADIPDVRFAPLLAWSSACSDGASKTLPGTSCQKGCGGLENEFF